MSGQLPGLSIADARAEIDEARCIGCTFCIRACPVDAIVGARRFLHTVLETSCTGCELCLPVCPVDCIVMQPLPRRDAVAREEALAEAERRAHARLQRLEREALEKQARAAAHRDAAARKQETLKRVLARANARLAARQR